MENCIVCDEADCYSKTGPLSSFVVVLSAFWIRSLSFPLPIQSQNYSKMIDTSILMKLIYYM